MPRALSDQQISDFRSRLCQAAGQLFIKNGVKGFTMRELASALNVSAMTPYRYFRNKSELLAKIRSQAFDQLADTLETASRTETDHIPQIHKLAEAYIRFAVEHPDSYRLMFNFPQAEEDDIPYLRKPMDRCRVWLTSYAREIVETDLSNGDPVKTVHLFWSMLHGAASLYLTASIIDKEELEVSVKSAMNFFISSYANKSKDAA